MMLNRECNLCGEQVQFTNVRGLADTLEQYGFPYNIGDFETLSFKNYGCPNCGSGDRDRLYKIYIERFITNSKLIRVLDFAPSAPFENYMRKKGWGKYRTADLIIDGVDDRIDITDMKTYKDSSFDFFICSHVVEHVSDDTKAFSELHRVLSPEGRGIIMTPIIDRDNVQDDGNFESNPSVPERWKRFAQDDHIRLYEKKVFVQRLKSAGFTVEQFGVSRLGYRAFYKAGITRKSVLYIVTKGGNYE